MITTNRLSKGLLLALCCGSLQSVEVVAQSKWSDALVSFVARQTADRGAKNGAQSKTGGKGDITIQTMTAGKIAKFTSGSGALEDSVIAESNGNIGIGTTAPAYKLHVEGADGQTLKMGTTNLINNGMLGEILFTNQNGGVSSAIQGWNPNPFWQDFTDLRFFTSNTWSNLKAERMRIDSNGNVGIGTTGPNFSLDVARSGADPTTNYAAIQVRTTGTAGYGPALILNGSSITSGRNWQLISSGGSDGLGLATGKLGFYDATASAVRMTFDGAGNVGIGTTAPAAKLHVAGGDVSVTGAGSVSLTGTGNITASGTISGGNVIAKYQDVAEWVPARNAIPPGTVVTLDPDHSNLVVASSHSYDTRVAGVVSEKPGVILGEGGEGKVMVATTGRVRVKVDATNGPIRVGDLLVTSDKEGIAMRSQPLDLGGTPIHRPGTLIGKALEPLEKGVGEILVLLSLQ